MHPRDTAVACAGVRETFGEFEARANRSAHALVELGVRRGDRVAILAHNCHRYLALYGAVAKLGAVLVPLNWRLVPAELSLILRDAEAKVLVFGQELRDAAEQVLAAGTAVEPPIALGTAEGPYVGLEDIQAESSPGPIEAEPPTSDDIVALIYTAAVDGKPRGAMLSHGNLLAANLQMMWAFGLTARDVHLNALPLFHLLDVGLALAVLHAGGRNIFIPRFDARAALEMIDTERVSVLGEFAPMLARLLEEQARAPRDLSSLRYITGLDQPAVIRDTERRTAARFMVAFGQTETSGFVTLSPFGERPGSSGREGVLSAVRIVDEAGRECRPGQIGEIVARGPLAFRGYWRMPEVSAYVQRGGWHHTGDLGYVDEDGYLWYVGRNADKELIKPGGENVYPVEVECIIAEHPGIKDVAVIGVKDSEWGEAIKAVCERRDRAQPTADEVVAFVQRRIASYKKPRYVHFVDALPRTPAGQLDRARIKELYGGAAG